GYKNVPIYSPNSRSAYSDFGLEKTPFRRLGWRGMVFIDCLIKALLTTRPYEVEKGTSENTYNHYLKTLQDCIIAGNDINLLAEEAAAKFAQIKCHPRGKPVIGLVGEIYLRNNRFSNNHLIEKLEALGMEVRLATFGEWVNYTSFTFKLDSLYRKRWKNIVKATLQGYYQHRDEKEIERHFQKNFPIEKESSIARVLQYASPYLPVTVRGEAVLSIGKAVDFFQSGASGIINCMPFNCMPGTIVTSLSRRVAADLRNIPWLNISYEGLQDTGEETRLEAFVEQVRNFARNSQETTTQRIA
ncbi:MAG: hypothetical protein AB1690_03255, partial [Candidatus Zixiibacteriota bacterium]